MIIVVDKADQVQTKTGKTYLSVVDKAGKKYSCWDTELWNIIEKDRAVEVEVEKKGNFANIVSAKSVADQLPEVVNEAVKEGAEVTSVTNVKNRAVSISYAKDLVCAGKIELNQLKTYADKFLAYIEDK